MTGSDTAGRTSRAAARGRSARAEAVGRVAAGSRRSGHWRRLGGALALVVIVLGGATAGPAGGSPSSPSSPAQLATAIELVDQPAWVRPGEPFKARLRVDNAPPGATVDMVVHDRLVSRSAFRRTLEGELGGVEHSVPPLPVAGDVAGVTTIGFSPEGDAGGLSERGVYPVEVRVVGPDGAVAARLVTYLTYLKADNTGLTPLAVGVILDIAAEPTLQPDGEYVLPPGALDRARERVDVLRDTTGVPLTLAPRPETLEGLFHAGPTAEPVTDELTRLAADLPVFARPFVDVDLAALQRADLLSEANAQADGGANVVRSRLGTEPTGGMWLSGPTLGADAAGVAVDLGIDRAVVPPTAVEPGDDGEAVVPEAPVRLGDDGPSTMVSDPSLAAHLTSGDGMVAAHRFLAELAITELEAPAIQRAVVVHLPPDADIDPDVVSTALGALGEGEIVQAVPVSQTFEVPPLDDGPTTVEPAPHDVDADLRSLTLSLQTARNQVAGVGALLDDSAATGVLEHSLLLSTGSATPDDQRRTYVDRAGAELGAVAGAVTLPDEFRITLTSRSSTIPVRVTNRSDSRLTVDIELDSDQLEFPQGDELTRDLEPGTTQIDVPVRVRTSGAFTLDVTVRSPEGSIVLDRSTFDIRSTAISGVGLVLSIGAGLFLAVWWARHWRSTRRSRVLVPADPGRDDAPGGPGGRPESETGYRPAHMAGHRSRGG